MSFVQSAKTPYISLAKATTISPYSQEYLSLRARQGKLKAIKLGRNWYTTNQALEEYITIYGQESLPRVAKAQHQIQESEYRSVASSRVVANSNNRETVSRKLSLRQKIGSGILAWIQGNKLQIGSLLVCVLVAVVLMALAGRYHTLAAKQTSRVFSRGARVMNITSSAVSDSTQHWSGGLAFWGKVFGQAVKEKSQQITEWGQYLKQQGGDSERLMPNRQGAFLDGQNLNVDSLVGSSLIDLIGIHEAKAFDPLFLKNSSNRISRWSKIFNLNWQKSVVGVRGEGASIILQTKKNASESVRVVKSGLLKFTGSVLVGIGNQGQNFGGQIIKLSVARAEDFARKGEILAGRLNGIADNSRQVASDILSVDQQVSAGSLSINDGFRACVCSVWSKIDSPLKRAWQWATAPWRKHDQRIIVQNNIINQEAPFPQPSTCSPQLPCAGQIQKITTIQTKEIITKETKVVEKTVVGEDNTKLPLAGGTITGPLAVIGQAIFGADDAAGYLAQNFGNDFSQAQLAVRGNALVSEDLLVGDNLRVQGPVSLAKTLEVGGDVHVTGSLGVSKMLAGTYGSFYTLSVGASSIDANGTISAYAIINNGVNRDLGVTLLGSGDLILGTDSDSYVYFSADKDTNLYRSNVGELRTDTSLIVGNTLTVGGTTTFNGVTYTWPAADGAIGQVLSTDGVGQFSWSAGGGGGSSSLWTDAGTFTYLTASSSDLTIGDSASSTAPFFFDVSGNMLTLGADTNLYRSGANELKTDDNLTIGGTLTLSNAETIANGTDSEIALSDGTNTLSFDMNEDTATAIELTTNGNIDLILNPGGTGLVGIKDTTPDAVLDINESRTSGILFQASYEAATSLAGNVTGLDIDLSTNVTPGAYNITGLNIEIPSGGTGTYKFAEFIEGSSVLYTFDNVSAQFNVPASFNAAGDVSLAYDLIMTNNSAGYIKFQGPGYIQTEDASGNYDLTLSGANAGNVVALEDAASTASTVFGLEIMNSATNSATDAIDKYGLYIDTSSGTFTGAGGTATNNYGLYVVTPAGADNNYAAIFEGGNVGIGTTTPAYLLDVWGTSRFGSATSTQVVFEGYVQSDIIPYADNSYSLGAFGYRWSNIYAATSTVGDLVFGNDFRITESELPAVAGLYIQNAVGDKLMTIDERGFVGVGTVTPARALSALDSDSPQMRLAQTDDSSYSDFQVDALGNLTISLSGDEMIIPDDNLKICSGGACPVFAGLLGNGNLVVENDVFIGGNLVLGDANTKTGVFAGLQATSTLATVDISGVKGNNPVVRRVSVYIDGDPGADTNVNCRLGFYNSTSTTENNLITDYYFNLTYTETDGGANAGETTDTVDATAGLAKYDLIRYLGGTAENIRLVADPSDFGLTFTALAGAHNDNTGVARVAEITNLFQLYDADGTNTIHAKLENLSGLNNAVNINMIIELQ